MSVTVHVSFDPNSGDRPPSGSPVRVELRDTSLADAPAVTVSAADGFVTADGGLVLATVELEPSLPDLTVWAHVDVSGDGLVSVGDLVTMESQMVPPSEQSLFAIRVVVRRVR